MNDFGIFGLEPKMATWPESSLNELELTTFDSPTSNNLIKDTLKVFERK